MEAQQDDCELQTKRNVEVVMTYYKGTNPAYHIPMITGIKIKIKYSKTEIKISNIT